MATKKGGAVAGNKGGRPRKDAADKLEQFSIRLPPKMKFGLELLARAQHRSLSQAVEWALQVGLANHVVNVQLDTSVADLVDKAWDARNPYERARVIYDLAPTLCEYDDYVACSMIDRSEEKRRAHDVTDPDDAPYAYFLFEQFAAIFWDRFREAASELAAKGRDLADHSLLLVLGLYDMHASVIEAMKRAIEMEGIEPIKRSDLPQPKIRPS